MGSSDKDKKVRAVPYQFENNTDTILQWMELLVQTGNINIVDGNEPSIGIEGIPVDVPLAILNFFADFAKRGGKLDGKDHAIVLRRKELKNDFI